MKTLNLGDTKLLLAMIDGLAEALALTWENVDVERRIVRIWPSAEWQPKSNRERTVPIGDVLLPWLAGKHPPRQYVFPAPTTGARYAVWPAKKFDRVRKAAVPDEQKRIHKEQHDGAIYDCKECRKHAVTGGVHTFRHTYASHFLRTTPDLYLLAQVLGHSDTRVTRLYAHLLPDHLDRARGAVSMPAPVGPAAVTAAQRWRVKPTAVSTSAESRDRKRRG